MLCYDYANEIGTKKTGSPIVCPYFIIDGRHTNDRRQISNKTLQHRLINAIRYQLYDISTSYRIETCLRQLVTIYIATVALGRKSI